MSTLNKASRLSVEDYLQLEERGEERHEYVNGIIHATVGGTVRHNLITTTATALLRDHLKGSSCTVFASDMKVSLGSVFYYPDVMVVCEKVDPDSLFQTSPVLIIEVLSKSTESKDRLEKVAAYQEITSLSEYVLISQDKVQIDIYRRSDDDWQIESNGPGDLVSLNSVQYQILAETFYESVFAISSG